MRADLKLIGSFILGALASFSYFYLVTSIQVAKIQGQVAVFSKFCPTELEKSGLIKKELK